MNSIFDQWDFEIGKFKLVMYAGDRSRHVDGRCRTLFAHAEMTSTVRQLLPNRFCSFERKGVMASSTVLGMKNFTDDLTRRNKGGRTKALK